MRKLFIGALFCLLSQPLIAVTLEEFNLLLETTQNIEGLRKNILDEATHFKDGITAKTISSDKVAETLLQDAGLYQVRLKWITNLINNPTKNQKVLNAFTAVGISEVDLNASLTELQAATSNILSADLSDQAHVLSALDAIIQSVGAHDKVFFNDKAL